MSHCAKCGRSVFQDAERCDSCGASRPELGFPVDPRVGRLVAGDQYRVVRRLGAGGFGVVYEVETLVGGLRRALKVLSARFAADDEMRERFSHEATVLEEIHDHNVARCYAAGYLQEDGEVYLLLELVEGPTLAQLMRDPETSKPRPLEVGHAVRLGRQIASGLNAAHRAGVLHRDLKPDNILVVRPGTPEERIKVVDFGIAKLLDAGTTSTQSIAGTPAYMAPEQFEPGRALDARVDLYCLGALLHTMLTGQSPFASAGTSMPAVMVQQRRYRDLGPRPSEVAAHLREHESLDLLVARLLASEADRRPASAAEVCDELARIEDELAGVDRGALGDLLSALCATPSPSAWVALLAYLRSPAGDREAVVEVAAARLGHWPDALRIATCGMWEACQRGRTDRLWPLVRRLDLSGRDLDDADVATLAKNPALATITELDLSRNGLGNAGVEALAGSPHLASVRVLNLSHNRVSSKGLTLLAESAACPRLESLDVSHNGIGERGAVALARWPRRLTDLAFDENDLGPGAAAAIAASEHLAGLKRLSLVGNRIGPDGAAALAASELLRSLERLELTRNAVGAPGAIALAGGDLLRSVRRLDLARNGLGRDGVLALLSSNRLDRLEDLDLSGNDLGVGGAMVLASAPGVRRVTRLVLSDNHLSDTGLAALLGSASLARLRELDLSQNQLGAAALAHLGETTWPLESLDLSRNPLGPDGARAVSASLRRLRLRRLALSSCDLRGEALADIVEEGRLDALIASDNPLGSEGAETVARARGFDRLEELDLSHADLGPRGAAAVASGGTSLRRLVLGSNRIGDEGAEAIVARAPQLSRLEELALDDDQLTARAARALAASSLARHLRSLDLSHGALGDAGAEALASGPGWHTLTRLALRANGIGLAGAKALVHATSCPFVSTLDLSDNALTGLVDVHSLGKSKVALMEESFALVAPMGADLAERFYELLFERFPAVRPLFASTDMSRQKHHLLSSLVLTIDNLRNPELVERNLAELGRRHLRYGVVATHYYAVTSTLMAVLRELLGESWTPEHEAAWSDGLRAIADTMMGMSAGFEATRVEPGGVPVDPQATR